MVEKAQAGSQQGDAAAADELPTSIKASDSAPNGAGNDKTSGNEAVQGATVSSVEVTSPTPSPPALSGSPPALTPNAALSSPPALTPENLPAAARSLEYGVGEVTVERHQQDVDLDLTSVVQEGQAQGDELEQVIVLEPKSVPAPTYGSGHTTKP